MTFSLSVMATRTQVVTQVSFFQAAMARMCIVRYLAYTLKQRLIGCRKHSLYMGQAFKIYTQTLHKHQTHRFCSCELNLEQ